MWRPITPHLLAGKSIDKNGMKRIYRSILRDLYPDQFGPRQLSPEQEERQRQLSQLVGEFVSRAGAAGLTVDELIDAMQQLNPDRR